MGSADHSGWAVLVTVANDGSFVDRRRVELIDPGLPTHPHHHEGQRLAPRDAVSLVERVRASADRLAEEALESIEGAIAVKVGGIAIRRCPPLPAAIADRITDYRAQCVADSVMYRQALAEAAKAKRWSVHWYDVRALDLAALRARFDAVKKSIGPPWQKDHKIAMAAAIAAHWSR